MPKASPTAPRCDAPGRRRRWSSAEVIERVVHKTLHETPEAATHWSIRKMARAVGGAQLHQRARIWKRRRLKPHLVAPSSCRMTSTSSPKDATISPVSISIRRDKALVLSVEEEASPGARDRTSARSLPIVTGRELVRHRRRWVRHGTTTLFAGSVATGKVIGHCIEAAPPSGMAEIPAPSSTPNAQLLDLHLIADRLRHPQFIPKGSRRWLAKHPRFHRALHSDIRLLAQPGNASGLITSDQIRGVRASPNSKQPFRYLEPSQCRSKTLRMDRFRHRHTKSRSWATGDRYTSFSRIRVAWRFHPC